MFIIETGSIELMYSFNRKEDNVKIVKKSFALTYVFSVLFVLPIIITIVYLILKAKYDLIIPLAIVLLIISLIMVMGITSRLEYNDNFVIYEKLFRKKIKIYYHEIKCIEASMNIMIIVRKSGNPIEIPRAEFEKDNLSELVDFIRRKV